MGGYSDDYLVQRTQEEKSLPKKESAPRERHAAERPQKLRFSFKEQREYDTIDADITALEEKTERWVYLNDLTERIAAQDRTT